MPPLVIEDDEIIVLLSLVDVVRYLTGIVAHREQVARGIKECHGAIDADAHVNAIMQGNIDDVLHVLERVPWRQAEHERQRHLSPQCFYNLNHSAISVTAPHHLVSFLISIKRDIQVAWMESLHGIDNPLRGQAIGQQRVIRVVLMEPCHDFISLRMQDEFTAFKPDGRLARDATAVHDSLDVIKSQVLVLFLPDVAMLAT